jgi:hypothetical protein
MYLKQILANDSRVTLDDAKADERIKAVILPGKEGYLLSSDLTAATDLVSIDAIQILNTVFQNMKMP